MIRVWSYLDELVKEEEEIKAAINRVLHSGILILGDNVREFEQEFSRWCGVEYGIGVNSGTDALFLALKALNVGRGDEVITVPNTAVPTVAAIMATGAKARFVDVEYETGLMNVELLADAVTSKTKVILPVHLYGQCVNMTKVMAIAKEKNCMVVEDCAQSHGAKQNNQFSGSFGQLSAFSFYPTKILGGYGDGGMVLTSDKQFDARLRRLRFYGMEGSYYSIEDGFNSRLDEIHAAILRTKLTKLDQYVERRRAIAQIYSSQLADSALGLPKENPGNFHAYYLYVVRHENRDYIMNYLKENDVHVNISYPFPIHTMPAYTHLGYKNGDFPVCEKLANEIFSLPIFPSLRNEDQEKVIATLKKAL